MSEAQPLLLLDNGSMVSVLNEGLYKCHNISFAEAKEILASFDDDEYLKCFSNPDIESVMFRELGIDARKFKYKYIRTMRKGQHAIVFKLYRTPSESNPVVHADDGVEAKKLQNVYAYCQYLMRLE